MAGEGREEGGREGGRGKRGGRKREGERREVRPGGEDNLHPMRHAPQ